MGFQPGNPGGPGRKPGTPNKINAELREMILGALSDAGGRKYLAYCAVTDTGAFLALVGKCLPKEITGGLEITSTHEEEVRRMAEELRRHRAEEHGGLLD